jgi:ubiquitin-protein ligase
LLGPAGSLYAGGTFKFEITIPKDYPFNKEYPKVKFLTKIWHPLPTSLGDVCLGEVKWSPTDKLANVADLLRGLLLAPSADNAPASGGGGQGALEMFESDRAAFDAKAREWTHKYAGGPAPKGATPAKPAPPPDPYPAQTKQLVEMGFERALVLKCLEQAKGDVNGAMERLLSA